LPCILLTQTFVISDVIVIISSFSLLIKTQYIHPAAVYSGYSYGDLINIRFYQVRLFIRRASWTALAGTYENPSYASKTFNYFLRKIKKNLFV